MTTTSLYGKSKTGGLSQYDRLKHWKKMGYSQGSLSFEMTKETERKMLDYAEHHFNERYFLLYVAKRESGQTLKRDHRNRMRQFMYSQLKIPKELQKSDQNEILVLEKQIEELKTKVSELDEEKESHGQTRLALDEEKKNHDSAIKEALQERESHMITKNESEEEKVGHIATRCLLDQEKERCLAVKQELEIEQNSHSATQTRLGEEITQLKQELENEVSQHNDTKSDQEQSTLLSFVTKDDYEAEVKRHMDTKATLQQEQADHEETRKKLDLEVQRNASDLSDQEKKMQKDDLEAEVNRHMDTKALLQNEQADHEETRKKLDLEVQRNNQNAKAIDTKSIVEEEAIQLSGAKELQG